MPKKVASSKNKKSRPSISPEDQENKMISLAMDLAEQQLEDGTASSQLITEFVKRASTKARLENEILAKQKDLVVAKTAALESQKRMEELWSDAMTAMKQYGGSDTTVKDDE